MADGIMGDQGDQGNQGGDQGGQNLPIVPQWAANFPADLTGDEGSRNFLGRFKGDGTKVEVPVELVKSAVEAQRTIGGMVKIPGEGAKPEEIMAFNKKIGVPEKPDAYEFKAPDGSPENFLKKERVEAFKKDAHELGIPKKQAEELFKREIGRQLNDFKTFTNEAQQTLQQRIETLKTDLGSEYENTIKIADKAVHFADSAMIDLFDKAGLLGHPVLVKGFAKIGKAMGEDVLKGVNIGTPSKKYTREEVDNMMRDPKYKLPAGDPVGEAWRKRVSEAFQQLYPGTPGTDVNPSSGRPLHAA